MGLGWDGRDERRVASPQSQRSTSLHQHPQADHVRSHVPENADASHRPGWALQRSSYGTCMHADCGGDATEREDSYPDLKVHSVMGKL